MKASPRRNNGRVGGQLWDPERYRRNASFVADYGAPVLELLAPAPGERILDLGCGEGALTARIAERASVIGVDASADQVAACRARGLEAEVVDGARLAFTASFDAVFSNAALHWMKDQDAVVDGVWRALVPGGRFVAECGAAGNVASVRDELVAALARRGLDGAAADPWRFGSAEEWRARLDARGFIVRSIEVIPRPTLLPGALSDWLDTFAEGFLLRLPAGERPGVKTEIEERLKGRLCGPNGRWTVDYVRLRFAALKPQE